MNYNIGLFIYVSALMVATCYAFDAARTKYSTGTAYVLSGVFAVAGMLPAYIFLP